MADRGEQDRDALDVVARRLIRNAMVSGKPVDQADYPHIDDDEFDRVVVRIGQIIGQLNPSEEMFLAAYEHLTGGAP